PARCALFGSISIVVSIFPGLKEPIAGFCASHGLQVREVRRADPEISFESSVQYKFVIQLKTTRAALIGKDVGSASVFEDSGAPAFGSRRIPDILIHHPAKDFGPFRLGKRNSQLFSILVSLFDLFKDSY